MGFIRKTRDEEAPTIGTEIIRLILKFHYTQSEEKTMGKAMAPGTVV